MWEQCGGGGPRAIYAEGCYTPGMAAPADRKIARWFFHRILWDTAGAARAGFWEGLWATRKILVAVGGSALLTWREWIEHHPPEIAIVALIHFVLVLAAIALLVYTGQWLRHSDKKSPSTPAEGPHGE